MRSKIGGKHSTIIGGRKSLILLSRIALNLNVKKIVPGMILAKKEPVGKGMRLKIAEVNKNGNIKLILSEGSLIQEIYIVTKASNYKEGLSLANKLALIIEK
jgi:hypothetical protein